MKILYVEDDTTDAALLAQQLRGLDLQIDCASTLEAGLVQLGSEPYDCVVLDWNLPDAIGPTSLAAIRARFPLVPVVIFSSCPPELPVECFAVIDKNSPAVVIAVEVVRAAIAGIESRFLSELIVKAKEVTARARRISGQMELWG